MGRYLQYMVAPKSLLAAAAIAAVALVPVLVAPAQAARRSRSVKLRAAERALVHSPELWATIDVCRPANQPNTVGIRGSMPGDGQSRDRMYMSFRLQLLNASKHWVNLASGASSPYMLVGSGASPRQGGTSFELKPTVDQPTATLRGIVNFQWRHGGKVLMNATQATSAGHKSLAGADPANYSAATCAIG